ncbi:P-loop containing nucleoside triphosphate hydrolase protein, partial [Thelephora ganbajun]
MARHTRPAPTWESHVEESQKCGGHSWFCTNATTPDRCSTQDALDTNMLDSQVLDTPDGLGTALRAIEAVCHRGDTEIAEMVAALDTRPYILEYVISVLEEEAYEKLSKWIVTGFPTSTTPNMMDTMSVRLLQRFSSSLLSVEYPPAADAPPNLHVLRGKVELSFNVLRDLEENIDSALTKRRTFPTSHEKGNAVTIDRHISPHLFDAMGIIVPTTDAEVHDVYVQVLSQLQSTLEYYLLVLRNPLLSEIFESSYTCCLTTKAVVGPDQSQNLALPVLQPMETALGLDEIGGFGEWTILLSTRVQKDLRDIKRADGAMFRIVMKKIKQLSQGYFSRGNRKSLTGPKMKLPIYEARVTGGTRIVYQIDCIPDLGNYHATTSQHECQVIRMFGIFTHAQLHRRRFWDNLSRQLQKRGTNYIERCTFRDEPLGAIDDVIKPALFPPSTHQDQDTSQPAPTVKVCEEDMKEIHSMLVLDKFVVLSQALLNSILADKEVAHVFSVSMQEQEIIEHPSSCYVIGRSGTGKTITMLFKMLGIQHTWQQYPDMGPKPRQVFVTQSQVLATKVEEYFVKLTLSLETAACSREELRVIENDVEQKTELVGQEDNKQWRSDLPKRFSELLDKHFPLFITYDRLCVMLENDIGLGGRDDGLITPKKHVRGHEATSSMSLTSPRNSRLRAGCGITSSSDYMQQFRRNFVSYGVFLASYWDHLPQTLTRVLDPALVFGEFMGVIKGSEDAVGAEHRCLDRESYKSLSVRSQRTFSHKRDDIYDLFTAYGKLKQKRQDYDAADRTHYILEALREGSLTGQKVDFLYVDEVQDNLLIDTLVLRTICANENGLFWAGDTAQAISIGSSFRFADLKAYQHRIEKQLSHELGLTPVESRTFELVTNYRSHSGIVNCARSVIELIMRYWPYSIDVLKPEQATIDGFRPIFFGDADLDKLISADSRGGAIGFGARQCILVRNDTTKARLKQGLQHSTIMTLYESKGSEFDDVSSAFLRTYVITDKTKVLLYNFFKDSTATLNQWRLVLEGVSYGGNLQCAPTFDETRHASICVELKFLYVAITRARKNLWIMDGSESAEPMKVYWSSKDQIEIWSPTAEMPRLAVTSTPEEWAETGRTMFHNEHYEEASVAFLRAGGDREAQICKAYLLRQKARLISATASTARTQAFVTAASAFSSCAQSSTSKQPKERLTCYGAAGECYSEARDLKNAGYSYRMAERYDEAACSYQEGGYVDEMVEVITQHKKSLDSDLLERLMIVAQTYYFKRLNFEAALKLFPSEKDALEFLGNWNLDEARLKLLIELGRILEAAEIHAKNNDMLKAVETLSKSAARGVDHMRPMIKYLLTGLRRGFTFGVPPSSTSPTASRLLALADQLDKSIMTEQEVDELTMFQAIRRADRVALRTLSKTFIGTGNNPAALLCLDHAFSSTLNLRDLSLVEIQALLSLYLDYIRLLDKFLRDESLAKGSNHQRLFGFQPLEENRYLVPKRTLLHGKLANQSGLGGQSTEGYRCGFDELRRGIVHIIKSRISDRTKIQNDACCDVHEFAPCLQSLIQKK